MAESIDTAVSAAEEIIFYGNKALHKRLIGAVADGRLCHAYLFFGQRGVGKRTLGKQLAGAILCRGEASQAKPCGSCVSCKKLFSGNHPDFYCYDGKEGRNAFHIDTIRALRQDAYIRPNESEYKVYLLPNAQDMTQAAANAFLKVLEEPPKHAVFILTATSKTSVPATILSRCIPFEVFPLSDNELREALTARHPDSGGELLERAILLSGGVLGRAEELVARTDLSETEALTRRAAEAIRRGRKYDLLSALHDGNTSRTAMLELLCELSILLRAAILHKLSAVLSEDELIKGLALRLTASSISEKLELLSKIRSEIEGNVNMTLFEARLTERLIG